MARIAIEPPTTFSFTTEFAIRASDLNYGNHLGHDSMLTIMQEARILYYRSLGFKDELSFEGNVGQVITDAAVIYKSESFLGDILTIKIGLKDFSKYGFDMIYIIQNKVSGREVAIGKIGIVCFDYGKRKIALMPESLTNKLRQ